ncbi:MAG: hypothetical protein QOH39_1595 [Verrucomicrobiota bacterium]|jgi:hypothetical protein
MPDPSASSGNANRLQAYLGLPRRAELLIAAGLLGMGSLFKFWNVFLYRFDSDESQHLHVIWAWTHGLVQYRDVFDNHMPLFHLLCAPLLGVLGEHATDLYWMRLLMVPLYFLNAWCFYRIGTIVFSRRIGLWAMLFASGMSVYHFCSTEFRTDNVWTVFWFLSLIVLVANPFDFGSFMVGGLFLGLCFGISMKTTLMLLTILSAFGIAIGLVGWKPLGLTLRKMGAGAAAFALCTAVVPLLIMGFFAARGVWSQFQYCVFVHNLEPANRNTYLDLLILGGGAPILIYATRKFIGKETNPTVAFRQAFLCLVCGMYFLLLEGIWRHRTREDYLPFFPLLALVCVAILVKVSDKLSERRLMPRLLLRFPLPAIAAALVMLLDLALRLPVTNEADKEVGRVRDVLALTNPGDSVFDCKGETVFRKRSVRYVLETITLKRIERGEIADELEGQSPESRARVAAIGGELPEDDEKFIENNYLSVGHGVMVAGSKLNAASTAGRAIRFHIAMPDRYEIISPDGPAAGLLDGTPSDRDRFLAVGEHTFVPAASGPLAVEWAQAADRHFTNFLAAPQLHAVYKDGSIKRPGRRIVGVITELPDPFLRHVSVFRPWNPFSR